MRNDFDITFKYTKFQPYCKMLKVSEAVKSFLNVVQKLELYVNMQCVMHCKTRAIALRKAVSLELFMLEVILGPYCNTYIHLDIYVPFTCMQNAYENVRSHADECCARIFKHAFILYMCINSSSFKALL